MICCITSAFSIYISTTSSCSCHHHYHHHRRRRRHCHQHKQLASEIASPTPTSLLRYRCSWQSSLLHSYPPPNSCSTFTIFNFQPQIVWPHPPLSVTLVLCRKFLLLKMKLTRVVSGEAGSVAVDPVKMVFYFLFLVSFQYKFLYVVVNPYYQETIEVSFLFLLGKIV